MSPVHSAVSEGRVVHRRHLPRAHAFRYRIAQLDLDLDEVERVFERRWLWSVDRRNLGEWRRSDYLGPACTPLKDAVLDRVEQATGERPGGAVRMLCHPRYAGYVFNPVTFYYCHNTGDALRAVVAEVTNTPWGERHAYVLDARRSEHAKAMRVSPFMGMDQRYTITLAPPGPTLSVHIESAENDDKAFDATLNLRRRPLGTSLGALRTLPLIYAHAAVLRAKGVRAR